MNIVLPNRPHATALQVEELGSYKLESHEQSVSYQVHDDSTRYAQGIIDEIDSDTDPKAMHTRTSVTTSRNVSINSASEDDNSIGTGGYVTRELYVDEQTKNVAFDDGVAEVKVTRIVLQEEEVTTAEIHEADENVFKLGDSQKGATKDLQTANDNKRARGTLANVESAEEGNADGAQKPRVNRQSSANDDKSRKGSLYDIEEKNEHADLTPEEAKQLRIKEIRAKARRASLLSKEPKTENNFLDDDDSATSKKPVVNDVDGNQNGSKKGTLLDKGEKIEQEGLNEAKPLNEEPIETKTKLQNGVKDDGELENDEYLENLLKSAQRQRSVLEEIIEQKSAVVDETDAGDVQLVKTVDVASMEPAQIDDDKPKHALHTKSDSDESQTASGT